MERKWVRRTTLCLSALALLCWTIMFLAGTDVWHDVGRPDIWNLGGPPYPDVRVFIYAFYLLFIVLSAHLILTVLGLLTGCARSPKGA